jgi:hypothetical protein
MHGVPDSSLAPIMKSDGGNILVWREDCVCWVLFEQLFDDFHLSAAVDDGEVATLANASHEGAVPLATHSMELVAVTRTRVHNILCKTILIEFDDWSSGRGSRLKTRGPGFKSRVVFVLNNYKQASAHES